MLVGAIAGLGFGEILLIIVIAIVVLGPEKTPLYAKKLGEGLTMFKQYSGKLASEIKENVAEPLAEVVQPLQEVSKELTEPFKDLAAEMDSFLHMMFGNTEISTHFNLSEKANSFSFGLNKEGKYVPFDLLSSGEKCLYALAMMMCLVAKSNSPLKVILIDDILDHLDDENAQAMFESLYNVQGIQFILAGVQKCSFENAPEIIIEVK